MKLASLLALVPLAVLLAPADAKACGGCFHGEEATPTQSPSVITDHRMVLAVTPTMTTLWDQVEYAGDPSEFAWVLPIRSRVTVGIGADSFITALDNGTAPVVRAPPSSCPPVAVPDSSGGVGCGSSADSAEAPMADNGGLGWQEDSGVYVTDRSVVGPYETVQIHGKDAGGILAWLRANKYVVPTELEPMLQKYVDEGFDFVAVRLRPGVGVHAMRPIRVSFKGAYPSLPLRMVRAGVGDSVGIKLFVIADGRWQTANFPTLAIDPKMLTWDFSPSVGRSDYVAIRSKESAKFDNRAFVVESSIDMTSSAIPYEPAPGYPDPPKADAAIPAVDSGAAPDATSDAEASSDAADDAPEDAATDAPAADTAPPEYDAGEKPDVDPYASDKEVAFGSYTMRRVTRLRADLPSRYLDVDLVLQADENQSALLPTMQVTKGINEVCASSGGSGGSSDTCDCTVPVTSSPVRMPAALCAAALALALVRRRR